MNEDQFRNKQILPADMQREIDLKNNPPLCVDRETLRDKFAIAALTGMLAKDGFGGWLPSKPEIIYMIADDMLKARGRK